VFFCIFELKTSKLSIFDLNGKNANFFLKFKKALSKKGFNVCLVEAVGVEPTSEKVCSGFSTCVVRFNLALNK